jgi:hypothetical protein
MPETARVNLDALANMANVPARFQHLVAGLEAWRNAALEQERDESKKRDRDFADMAAEMAQIRQQEIDSNRLKLNIGGEDVDISQGDLREIMEKRAKDLREQRDQMARSGASASELERMDNLLDQYDTLNGELKDGKVDSVTMEAIEELSKQDRGLEAAILNRNNRSNDIASPRASFASEALGVGSVPGSALKDAFSRSASPEAENAPTESKPQPPRPEVSIQSLDF